MLRTKSAILLLILIGLCVYLNVLFNSFIGDDFLQIVNNQQVHSLTNIPQFFTGSTYETGGADKVAGLFYRPLMLVSFALLYHFFHLNTSAFHLFQILLHISNALLLYLFLKYFFKNSVAFFISLIFLLHPVNNEAVVYSANLQEALFFFFGIISLNLLKNKTPSLANASVVSFLILLSLLSKESGILFICITLVYALFYKKPFFKPLLLTHGSALFLYLIFRYPIAKMHLAQGSITPLYNAPLVERLIQIPAIVFYYLKTFFFPLYISSHHFWIIKNLNFPGFYLLLVILIISLALIIFFGFHIVKHASKSSKHYLFFSIWFISGVLLHLQIYPLDMTVADRWFYFPIVGLLGMISILFEQGAHFSTRLNQPRSKNNWVSPVFIKKIIYSLLIIIIGLLSFRTFMRNFDWKDELTLFGRDIKVTPQNFVLDNLYATSLITDGQIKKAKPYVESSIKEYPYYANLNNMAIIYASEGNFRKAKEYLKRAVNKSGFYVVYENYANFLLAYDDLQEAEKFTKQALKNFPKNSKLWLILAKIFYIEGDRKEAIQSAEKAYSLFRAQEYFQTLQDIKVGKLEDPRKYIILKK